MFNKKQQIEIMSKHLNKPQLLRFTYNFKKNFRIDISSANDILDYAFCWDDAPEGRIYWGEIFEQLGGEWR